MNFGLYVKTNQTKSFKILLSFGSLCPLGKSFWRAITIIIPYEKALAVRSAAHALRCEIGLMCVSQTFSIEKASSNISLHCSGTNKPWCYTCDTKWRKPRFDDYPTECKCSQCTERNSCSTSVMYFLQNTARELSLRDIKIRLDFTYIGTFYSTPAGVE